MAGPTGQLPSVMGGRFGRIPAEPVPRSQFKLSHGLKTTFDAGYMVPIFCEEVIPADMWNLRMTHFARLATPLHPFMDNLRLDFHFVFVPYRLVWDKWEKFNGAQDNPGDSTDFLVPVVNAPTGGFVAGSVYDHVGIPPGVDNLEVSALPFRAHNLWYNEWIRDQNLQQSLPVPKGDGPDDETNYKLYRRGKRHDYFTSALPWPQKGSEVQLPISGNAPIKGVSPVRGLGVDEVTETAGPRNQKEYDAKLRSYQAYFSEAQINIEADPSNANWPYVRVDFDDPDNPAYADMSQIASVTITALRNAATVQQIYELDARGGTRYTEILRSHFGVISPDMRLQRPEFLGGGSSNVTVNPIAQTSETTTGTPQGNLAAMGTSSGRIGFSHSFTEHGVVLGYASLRADLNYQQGLNRMWSRRTRFDFYWPTFAHLSEQAILNKEIYAAGDAADDDVFAYQERYAEYRYKPSMVTNEFRSSFAQSLDSWHLTQDFETRPAFNDVFIEDNPPVDRVIAVQDEPHMIFDAYFEFTAARPMPVYSVPGIRRI